MRSVKTGKTKWQMIKQEACFIFTQINIHEEFNGIDFFSYFFIFFHNEQSLETFRHNFHEKNSETLKP